MAYMHGTEDTVRMVGAAPPGLVKISRRKSSSADQMLTWILSHWTCWTRFLIKLDNVVYTKFNIRVLKKKVQLRQLSTLWLHIIYHTAEMGPLVCFRQLFFSNTASVTRPKLVWYVNFNQSLWSVSGPRESNIVLYFVITKVYNAIYTQPREKRMNTKCLYIQLQLQFQ